VRDHLRLQLYRENPQRFLEISRRAIELCENSPDMEVYHAYYSLPELSSKFCVTANHLSVVIKESPYPSRVLREIMTEYAEEPQWPEEIRAWAFFLLADCARWSQPLAQTQEWLKQSLSLFEVCGSASGIAFTKNSLADVLSDAGRAIETSQLYMEAGEIFKKLGKEFELSDVMAIQLAKIHHSIAWRNLLQQDTEMARQNIESARKLVSNITSPHLCSLQIQHLAINNRIHEAKCLILEKKLEKAGKCLRSVLREIEQQLKLTPNSIATIRERILTLSRFEELYIEKEDFPSALESLRKIEAAAARLVSLGIDWYWSTRALSYVKLKTAQCIFHADELNNDQATTKLVEGITINYELWIKDQGSAIALSFLVAMINALLNFQRSPHLERVINDLIQIQTTHFPNESTPDEIYRYFQRMPLNELEILAHDAIEALSSSKSFPEAETAIRKMAPFFLDCTFPKLPAKLRRRLEDTLDAAENSFGSLASALGLDTATETSDLPKEQSINTSFQEKASHTIIC